MVTTLEEAKKKYGEIVNGKWADEAKWCILLAIPDIISAHWINSATGQPTKHIYCNKDMAPFLLQALQAVQYRGLLDQLKTFDGCFQIRDVRAMPGQQSTHSYALAIDINAKDNVLGQKPTMTQEFVNCFTEVGFSWGGRFKRLDGMHFSRAWE